VDLKVTRYDIDAAGVATITLDRPGRGNSWTGRMHDEYRWICKRLDDDPAVRVIVLTGAGSVFCAGADFKALDSYVGAERYDTHLAADAERPGYGVRPEFDADMVWQLGMRTPMIAAVNGACAGIAVALAAFCDLRFAVDDAKITTVAPRIGLPAEYGLAWILPRLMGVTHAADVLLTGRVILAEEMRGWGFFNRVLPREEFAETVAAYAHQLAAVSPAAATDDQAPALGRSAARRPARCGRAEQGTDRRPHAHARLRRGCRRPHGEAQPPLRTPRAVPKGAVVKVRVESALCQGHNRCYALAPDPLPARRRRVLQRGRGRHRCRSGREEAAELAADNCPEMAVLIDD
jgi:enoyl-CoA hydratase/carnithine racemase/ferredoxin